MFAWNQGLSKQVLLVLELGSSSVFLYRLYRKTLVLQPPSWVERPCWNVGRFVCYRNTCPIDDLIDSPLYMHIDSKYLQ